MKDHNFNKFRPLAVLCLFQLCIFGFSACDSKSGLEKEVASLKIQVEQLNHLRQDVESLKSALNNQSTSVSANSSTQDPDSELSRARLNMPILETSLVSDGSELNDPFLGSEQASTVVMAFIDYQCQPCRKFFQETFPKLKAEFADSGKIRLIARDFPLASNVHAKAAAVLAHCAGEQGSYWSMFDLLFQNSKEVDEGNLDLVSARLVSLDQTRLGQCIKSNRYSKELQEDIEQASKLGAKGAPGFFIGNKTESGKYAGVFVRGAQPYPVIRAEIQKSLAAGAN